MSLLDGSFQQQAIQASLGIISDTIVIYASLYGVANALMDIPLCRHVIGGSHQQQPLLDSLVVSTIDLLHPRALRIACQL